MSLILLKNNHISLYSFGRWRYVISHEQRCCHSQVILAHDVDGYLLLVQRPYYKFWVDIEINKLKLTRHMHFNFLVVVDY
jgi:hypothetical protein